MNNAVTIESVYLLTYEEGRDLLEKNFHVRPMLCVCDDFVLYLRPDGRVEYVAGKEKADVKNWKMIKKLSAGKRHIAALTFDGKVLAVGDNTYGQCDVGKWSGVTDIEAGAYCTAAVSHIEGMPFDKKMTAVAGSFLSEAPVNKQQSDKTKKTNYRIPDESMEKYGGMVDFANSVLGNT